MLFLKRKYLKPVVSYTMIEILMTAVIIAIISGIVIGMHRKTVLTAKLKQAQAQLELIYAAEKQYYLDHDTYTTDVDDLGLFFSDSADFEYEISAAANSFTATASFNEGNCILSINNLSDEVNKTGCNF